MHEQSACGGEEKERSVQRERQSERRCRRCFQNDSRALRSKKCAIVWARMRDSLGSNVDRTNSFRPAG